MCLVSKPGIPSPSRLTHSDLLEPVFGIAERLVVFTTITSRSFRWEIGL